MSTEYTVAIGIHASHFSALARILKLQGATGGVASTIQGPGVCWLFMGLAGEGFHVEQTGVEGIAGAIVAHWSSSAIFHVDTERDACCVA